MLIHHRVMICVILIFGCSLDLYAKPKEEVISGAWGDLVIKPAILKPPLSFIEDACSQSQTKEQWTFTKVDPSSLPALLANFGLSNIQIEDLLKKTVCSADPKQNCIIYPTDEDILSLTPDVRQKLYHHIGYEEHKEKYFYAFRWYADASMRNLFTPFFSLSENYFQDFLKLIYQDGNYYKFHDFELMCRLVKDGRERIDFIQSLLSTKAMIVYLKLTSSSNLEQISNYWSKGGRLRQILPFLQSLQPQNPEETIYLDIINFLPRFAKVRLNTFPNIYSKFQPDCHYVTFNFFSLAPLQNRVFSTEEIRNMLSNDYEFIFEEDPKTGLPLKPEAEGRKKEFGDIMVFTFRDGTAIHAANYIADGLVFTKNGASYRRPYVFMRLEDLKAIYFDTDDIRILIHRKRKIDDPSIVEN